MTAVKHVSFPVLSGGTSRTLPQRFLDLGVNIKEFGAIGDGTSHPLSSIYGSLAAAQAVYPFVDELVLEVDGVATQAANDWMWEQNSSLRKLYAPAGRYFSSLPIFIDPAGHMRGSHAKWAIGTTYSIGDVRTWNGIPWISLTNSNVGNKPFVARGLGDGANTGEIVVYRNQYYRALTTPAQWWALIGFDEPFDAEPDDVTWELASSTLHWAPHYDQPTEFHHSFYFTGDQGVPAAQSPGGTQFKFGVTSFCFVGSPGNGVMWDSISVCGITDNGAFGYRMGQPAGGIGFAQAGGSGGSSRALWRNCEVFHMRTGWKTGFNSDALCDSNSWEKCNGYNLGIGIHIYQSQNFINKMTDCSISANRFLVSEVGGGGHVIAGNPSTNTSEGAGLAISAVSGLTVVAVGNQFNISLTATVVPNNYLLAGVYEYAFIETEHFGVMPFLITGFNAATNVISLEGLPEYIGFYFGGQNPDTTTDLEAELQAPVGDLLYCAELIVVASGSDITLEKIHIENSEGATCLIDNSFGGSNSPNTVRNVIYNYDPCLPYYRPSANPSAANRAKYYAATLLPMIRMRQVECSVSDSYLGQRAGSDPVTVSWTVGSTVRLSLNGVLGFMPNAVVAGNGGFDFYDIRTDWNAASLGAKLISDETPFISGAYSDQDAYRKRGWGAAPGWGVRPAGYAVPMITPAQLTALQSPPAITYAARLKGGLGSNYGTNLSAAGTGYTANDVLTLVGGTFSQAAQITVYSVNGSGVITAWYTSRAGVYSVAPTSFTVTGGTGTGATFNQPQWSVTYSAPYPAPWGGQVYRIGDWNAPAPADRVINVAGGGGGTITLPGARFMESNHKFYSLGQDLTTTNVPKLAWSYKGKSYAVYANEEAIWALWNGQGVLLDNGTDPEKLYIVTGRMPGLGYFTVGAAASVGDDTHLNGDKNTVFDGTVIGQEPYDITTF